MKTSTILRRTFTATAKKRTANSSGIPQVEEPELPVSQPNKDDHTFCFNPSEFKTFKMDLPPELSEPVCVQPSELLKYYEQMQLIRRMEMKADALYKNRMIRGLINVFD